jgi:fructan beta-fructosidase
MKNQRLIMTCAFAFAFLLMGNTIIMAQSRPDIVIADFEGVDYGPWKVEGTAFGSGPARGTLPGQMEVAGFEGKGLANSYNGGDDSIGKLTSPPMKIERKFITFRIGGGGFDNETCMNLLVEGKVVRIATGPNVNPGGSERLAPAAWDVAEFAGREATLVIVDQRKGGWGHINVDHIVLTDDRGSVPFAPTEHVRRLRIDADYLQLPQLRRTDNNKPGVENFTIEEGGKVMRRLHLEFPEKDQQPDFWYSADVREFRGREVAFRYKTSDAEVLERLTLSNKEIIDPLMYEGPHRPRFHFSPRMGWMNDINGSYYQDGLYHIFYQANPTTAASSCGFDMHWAHSVSKDLVHWQEWPIALYPDANGQCWSGTALLINESIPGVNDKSPLPTPALFFTTTARFTQDLATSSDGGRSWKRFAGNPVVPNINSDNRDPKVFWHEPSRHYIMLLYVGDKGYAILRSKNLAQWEQVGALPNWFECPEFIPMKSPTTGEDLWMVYGCHSSPPEVKDGCHSSSAYQLGRFDGKTFTPVSKPRNAHQGPNFYAALTFVNEPNDRRVMMGWARDTHFPGEPFNQCASVPLRLTLKAINGLDTLCFEPAEELNRLRDEPLFKLSNVTIAEARTKLQTLTKDTPLDVVIRLRGKQSTPIRVSIRQTEFTLEPATGQLAFHKGGNPVSSTVIHPEGAIAVRFLIDHGIIECFWNEGEAAYSISSLHTEDGPALALDGEAMIEELIVYPMSNIWK